jgi:uncharacterized protein YggT (Ycf19 family)
MFRIIRAFINIFVGIIELLLTFRLIFKFLVVNAGTPFVAWLYGVTTRLVAPFDKIIPDLKVSGFVIDFATIAALIVYAIAGSLILMIFSYPDKETDV